MDFFKNGTGWCRRHNPNKKVPSRKSQAPVFRKKERKLTSLQAAIQETIPQCDIEEANKSTSSQALEHKPSSPEPRGQASSPRNSVPGSGIQGTSGSVQASRNRKQG